jgi:hypothetical protein
MDSPEMPKGRKKEPKGRKRQRVGYAPIFIFGAYLSNMIP